MSENEEKGYEVIDKRKVKLGEDGEVRAAPEIPEDAAVSDEEKASMDMSGLPPVDVYSLIKSFIGILGSQVWQWLGLVKNPVTGQMEKDFVQAKIAIDTITVLAKQLEGTLDPGEQRELQAMISDLQMNFVHQSARQA